jgi:hypothetical protein
MRGSRAELENVVIVVLPGYNAAVSLHIRGSKRRIE